MRRHPTVIRKVGFRSAKVLLSRSERRHSCPTVTVTQRRYRWPEAVKSGVLTRAPSPNGGSKRRLSFRESRPFAERKATQLPHGRRYPTVFSRVRGPLRTGPAAIKAPPDRSGVLSDNSAHSLLRARRLSSKTRTEHRFVHRLDHAVGVIVHGAFDDVVNDDARTPALLEQAGDAALVDLAQRFVGH